MSSLFLICASLLDSAFALSWTAPCRLRMANELCCPQSFVHCTGILTSCKMSVVSELCCLQSFVHWTGTSMAESLVNGLCCLQSCVHWTGILTSQKTSVVSELYCLQSFVHWTGILTSRLVGKVKLVGSTISCEGTFLHGNISAPYRQHPHVQSYAMATDQVQSKCVTMCSGMPWPPTKCSPYAWPCPLHVCVYMQAYAIATDQVQSKCMAMCVFMCMSMCSPCTGLCTVHAQVCVQSMHRFVYSPCTGLCTVHAQVCVQSMHRFVYSPCTGLCTVHAQVCVRRSGQDSAPVLQLLCNVEVQSIYMVL